MLKIIFKSALLVFALFVIGCQQMNISDPVPIDGEKNVKLVIDQTTFQKAEAKRVQGQGESDPFKIEKVERVGDSLIITVSYGGGCQKHTFDLIWDGQILLSYPPQINLLIAHHANGDACKQLVTESLKISLKEMFGNDDYSTQNYVFNVFSLLNRTQNPDAVVAPPPDIRLSYLLAAPETTMVNGRAVYLTTQLWRDFMPISPPDGKPLGGVVFITAMDGMVFGNAISSDAVWLVHNQEVWKGWLTNASNGGRTNQLAKSFSDGPKWKPGVSVDVVVRLNNDQNNVYFLRASKQLIHEIW